MCCPFRATVPAVLVCALAVACGSGGSKIGKRCDLASPDCPTDGVCIAQADGEAICEAICDPVAVEACADPAEVCERLTSGEHACFAPVVIRGRIFDSADDAGIEGAQVLAADESGAVVTGVAVSDVDGNYELQVPIPRDEAGALQGGLFTLRASAADYLAYPHGIRPSIPVDTAGASEQPDGSHVVQNVTTDVALIPLDPADRGAGSIAGTVMVDNAGGALVVAECGAAPCPFTFADRGGAYHIFNVPDGSYTVTGYKAGLSLEPAPADIAGGADLTGIDLVESQEQLGTISGSINIVNAPGGSASSVVLVPESTFVQLSQTFVRGDVPPGLRDPLPPSAPVVDGAFTIADIPAGDYVILAAFENDFLVRDPDPGIAGTQIVHISIPDGGSYDVTVGESFKVTEALGMVGPGASGPESVDEATLTFSFNDDSGEDRYEVVVYDAFGSVVWMDDQIPGVSGSATVDVPYAGPALTPGMYYQWRAIAHKDTGGTPGPISTTEDLLGVFYIPSAVL